MRFLVPLPLLLTLASSQFVFFGGNQQRFAPQRFAPQPAQRFAPQPARPSAPQAPRFAARPSAPTFTRDGRFSAVAGTFFRPNTPLMEVKKTPAVVPAAVAPVAAAAAPVAAAAAPVAAAASPVRAAAPLRVAAAAPLRVAAAKPKGNYQWGGKGYLLTWRTGRNNFGWNDGVKYCKSQGMKLISLDTKEKAEHFLGLVGRDRAPYFWTGGQVSADSRTLSWQNGESEAVTKGQHPWSFTGRTGPQPDGGERCLAVLNNTYRDGVKYHDVACHHRKPVVCEE